MRQHQTQIVLIACLCSVAMVFALPVKNSNQKELDILQVPLNNGQELDVLSLGDSETLSERNKRTVGLLRQLFPELTEQIDAQANKIIGQILRVLGPTVLRTAIQGNAGAGGGSSSNSARSDFDADFDDDDDNSSSSDSGSNSNSGSSSSSSSSKSDSETGTRVQIDLPTFSPDDADNETDNDATFDNNSSTQNSKDGNGNIDLSALNQQLEETIRVARQASEAERAAEASNTNEVTPSKSTKNDQQTSESKAPAIDDLSLDSGEDDLDDRNKRFLTFGADASTSSSGSGSGNFLFNIIRNQFRQTADRAIRTAGQMYEYYASAEKANTTNKIDLADGETGPYHYNRMNSIDLATATINDGLFSGSVQTQSGDESANEASVGSGDGSDDDATRSDDGYSEGIPGPVTRLVVLANRGLANLVQDLILRIAATSERFVNFKAKVITALI